MSPFAEATMIETDRLRLIPLRAEDADELVSVLSDERLHRYIGGRPDTLAELRERYTRLLAGSPDPDEVWRNWVVRDRDSQALGTVQATIRLREGRASAMVAWVIGVDWQNQGFGSEAAQALVARLQQEGVDEIVAHVHPDHRASEAVATRAGLRPTDELVDGERVWRAGVSSSR